MSIRRKVIEVFDVRSAHQLVDGNLFEDRLVLFRCIRTRNAGSVVLGLESVALFGGGSLECVRSQEFNGLSEVVGGLSGVVCSLDDGLEEVECLVKVVIVGQDRLALGPHLLVSAKHNQEETVGMTRSL